MEIGTTEPAIWIEPAEDPFELPKPTEVEVEQPVEVPDEVEVPA